MNNSLRITKAGKRIFKENGVYNNYQKTMKKINEIELNGSIDDININSLNLAYQDLQRIIDVINYEIIYDKYNKDYENVFQRIIYKLAGKEFNNNLIKHQAQLNYYKRLVNELKVFKKSLYTRSIDDIKNALNLAYSTLIAFHGQMKKDDYNLLNRGKYVDSDIMYYENINNDVIELYGNLKYKNMLHNKNIKTK